MDNEKSLLSVLRRECEIIVHGYMTSDEHDNANQMLKDIIQDIKALPDPVECETCKGTGKCNDADFGDISYNTWTCRVCNGQGVV